MSGQDALFITLAIGAAVLFWVDSLRTREAATAYCKDFCLRHGVQFLDQTVALRNLRPGWGPNGLYWLRVYGFEYSEEGVGRHRGHLLMQGRVLKDISLAETT